MDKVSKVDIMRNNKVTQLLVIVFLLLMAGCKESIIEKSQNSGASAGKGLEDGIIFVDSLQAATFDINAGDQAYLVALEKSLKNRKTEKLLTPEQFNQLDFEIRGANADLFSLSKVTIPKNNPHNLPEGSHKTLIFNQDYPHFYDAVQNKCKFAKCLATLVAKAPNNTQAVMYIQVNLQTQRTFTLMPNANINKPEYYREEAMVVLENTTNHSFLIPSVLIKGKSIPSVDDIRNKPKGGFDYNGDGEIDRSEKYDINGDGRISNGHITNLLYPKSPPAWCNSRANQSLDEKKWCEYAAQVTKKTDCGNIAHVTPHDEKSTYEKKWCNEANVAYKRITDAFWKSAAPTGDDFQRAKYYIEDDNKDDNKDDSPLLSVKFPQAKPWFDLIEAKDLSGSGFLGANYSFHYKQFKEVQKLGKLPALFFNAPKVSQQERQKNSSTCYNQDEEIKFYYSRPYTALLTILPTDPKAPWINIKLFVVVVGSDNPNFKFFNQGQACSVPTGAATSAITMPSSEILSLSSDD